MSVTNEKASKHLFQMFIKDPKPSARTSIRTMSIKAEDNQKDTGATIPTSTFNLAKNIIGAGVLSLPAGVAFIADSQAALFPSAALTTLMGLISAYSFSLIGKACAQHNTKSFQETWAKSVDENSAWMISAGITAMCFLTALAYSIIIGM
jgi:sodium-coupled neutral amino acid transporter 11